MSNEVKWQIKLANYIYLSGITISTLAGTTNMIITHASSYSKDTQAWITCVLLTLCLIALVLLSISAIIRMYFVVLYTFKKTIYAIGKNARNLFCVFILGITLNIALLISSTILAIDLNKAHRVVLPFHHSTLVSNAVRVLSICCLINAIFAVLSLALWIRTLTRFLHDQPRENKAKKMISLTIEVAASFIELFLTWLFFSAGFMLISFKLSNTVHLNKVLSNEAFPTVFFALGMCLSMFALMEIKFCKRIKNSDFFSVGKILLRLCCLKLYLYKKFMVEANLNEVIQTSIQKPSSAIEQRLSNPTLDKKTMQQEKIQEQKSPSIQIDKITIINKSAMPTQQQDDECNTAASMTTQISQTEEHEITKVVLN